MLVTITEKGTGRERNFDHSQVVAVDTYIGGGTIIKLDDNLSYIVEEPIDEIKTLLKDAGCCTNEDDGTANCTDFVPGGEVNFVADPDLETHDINIDVTPTTYPSGMTLADMTSIEVSFSNADGSVQHATQTFNSPIVNPLVMNDTTVQDVINGSAGETILVTVVFSFDASGINCTKTMSLTIEDVNVSEWINNYVGVSGNLVAA